MILAFALLAQVTALATTGGPKAAPVRVWIADSSVYVRLRDPGYLTVLHIDPVGRIRVLFPLNPDDAAVAPGGATLQLPAPLATESGTGTIVAARSGRPLQVAGLRAGPFWDYDTGMLFQPTAGNAVAALLDIADRMADGRPFDFDVTTYRTGGVVAARDAQLMTPVCLGCVRSYPAPAEQQSTVVVDQSNTVDCSSANLVNSFCGVVDNRVTNTYVYNEVAAAPEPVYVPYYVPVFIRLRRRLSQPPSPPPQRTLAIVSPLRRVSGPVVPPPPRRRFVIDVQQPRQQRYAPIEPRQREAPAVSSALPPGPRIVRRVNADMPVRPSVSWQPAAPQWAEVAAPPALPPAEPMHGTLSLPVTRTWTSVPSSALVRSIRTKPH